jgi:hypothetical protein
VFTEMPMGAAAQEKRATSLVARFQSRTIKLPDHPALAKQCKSIRLTRHPGGRTSVGAPEGKKAHDDLFDTLLLATEIAQTMPDAGGDIVVEYGPVRWDSETREVSGAEARYFRVSKDGRRTPCGPPIGTGDWLRIRKEQKAAGLHVLGEPDPDDFERGLSLRVFDNE